MKRSATGFGRGFWRDRRGVSALEFALIAPVLIFFYMGMAELSQAMTAKRRISHAASAVGDLVTQESGVTRATVDDILNAAVTTMRPFPTNTLKLRVTSVTADANNIPKVDWSRGNGGYNAFAKGTNYVGLPNGLISANENILVSEAAYTYTSPVASVLPVPFNFIEKFYLRGRKSAKVECPDCNP
jgi:Flp pilus assembly protein TadG